MHITFILPCVGRKPGKSYIRTWSMEPLSIAVLSALTPPEIKRRFFDDRLEAIDYDAPTDLVALSVETYTAKRAFQIAARYRARGVPVVMGGFHPTLAPDDAAAHADAIVLGQAEDTWPRLLTDFSEKKMKERYVQQGTPSLKARQPDRSIYADKTYQPIALVETGRGCKFNCEFCSITRFYNRVHTQRPVEDVVAEIATLDQRYVFFTDDNLGVRRERFRELLTALIPLGISWSGQVSIDIAKDHKILSLMRRSGCVCVLIGFESMNPEILSQMGKAVNVQATYESAAASFSRQGIGVYGTFVFGYDGDNQQSFNKVAEFAKRNGFFFAAFNHVVPFPGTRLYERLQNEGRLLYDKWWLSDAYHFGDIAFRTRGMSEKKLAENCYKYRQSFYGPISILRRLRNWRANCRSLRCLFLFVSLNWLSRKDVTGRQELPLGIPKDSE